jgi:hypothetical protein
MLFLEVSGTNELNARQRGHKVDAGGGDDGVSHAREVTLLKSLASKVVQSSDTRSHLTAPQRGSRLVLFGWLSATSGGGWYQHLAVRQKYYPLCGLLRRHPPSPLR